MVENTKQIAFRGDTKYRKAIKQAALDHGLTVQQLIENALDPILNGRERTNTQLPPLSTPSKEPDILSGSGSDITDPERGFLSECLRIYRSQFGRPLQENVTFFGIGLSAVEQIAKMKVTGGRADHDPGAMSPGERRAFAIADHAENEAHLLEKAKDDVVEELRRSRAGDPGAAGRTDARRKSGPRKTGSGS